MENKSRDSKRRPRKPWHDRCVTEAAGVEIVCEDCGHAKRWHRQEILSLGLRSTTTFAELHGRLYCAPCKGAGGPADNVQVIPKWSVVALVNSPRRQ
jgi:hypothetical protein